MQANIFEIKCPVDDPESKHQRLIKLGAREEGIDHQIDIYYNISAGRLKLRQGTIENTLIRYHRPESKEMKNSKVLFQKFDEPQSALHDILSDTLGVWKVVDKERRIYFIENVKFHIDEVKGLGSFMEIEAIDVDGSFTDDSLAAQCRRYIDLLELDPKHFIDRSYSDMIPSSTA